MVGSGRRRLKGKLGVVLTVLFILSLLTVTVIPVTFAKEEVVPKKKEAARKVVGKDAILTAPVLTSRKGNRVSPNLQAPGVVVVMLARIMQEVDRTFFTEVISTVMASEIFI